MSIRALITEQPQRAIALATSTHVLIFRHSPSSVDTNDANTSQTPLQGNGTGIPRCMVEFSAVDAVDLSDYRSLSSLSVYGTLGLITVNHDVFLCVVSSATTAATIRPEETIQRINAVEFRMPYEHHFVVKAKLLTLCRLSKQLRIRHAPPRSRESVCDRSDRRRRFRLEHSHTRTARRYTGAPMPGLEETPQ